MFAFVRALTYASLFIGFLLVYLPAQLLSRAGVGVPPAIGPPEVAGMVVAAAGGALAVWCILAFAIIGKGTPAPFDPPRRLVIRGPYRFVRNPMYLGAGTALLGAALFYRSTALLGYAALFLVITHAFVLVYEEPTLRRLFGAEYEAYAASAGRWLPRLRRRGAPPPLLLVGLVSLVAAGVAAQRPPCTMRPPYTSFTIPARGFASLPGDVEPCESVPDSAWTRAAGRGTQLAVSASGPEGSGRYWIITTGITGSDEPPRRGVCFTTSTVGWRTLRDFGGQPLHWIQDSDRDGNPELVVWSSFPLAEEASAAEFGLVAWVYELRPRGRLALDRTLSRRLARAIVAAYRAPAGDDAAFQALREEAARRLTTFADGACEVRR